MKGRPRDFIDQTESQVRSGAYPRAKAIRAHFVALRKPELSNQEYVCTHRRGFGVIWEKDANDR